MISFNKMAGVLVWWGLQFVTFLVTCKEKRLHCREKNDDWVLHVFLFFCVLHVLIRKVRFDNSIQRLNSLINVPTSFQQLFLSWKVACMHAPWKVVSRFCTHIYWQLYTTRLHLSIYIHAFTKSIISYCLPTSRFSGFDVLVICAKSTQKTGWKLAWEWRSSNNWTYTIWYIYYSLCIKIYVVRVAEVPLYRNICGWRSWSSTTPLELLRRHIFR